MAKAVTQRVKRKEKKNITAGVAHVNSTFNNTRVQLPTHRVIPLLGLLRALKVLKVLVNLLLMLLRLLLKKQVKKLKNMV